MKTSEIIQKIKFLVAPQSSVVSLMPGILLAELHLKDAHKISACHKLNFLFKELHKQHFQLILAVINDDNDRYIRLIGRGIQGHTIDTDKYVAKKT